MIVVMVASTTSLVAGGGRAQGRTPLPAGTKEPAGGGGGPARSWEGRDVPPPRRALTAAAVLFDLDGTLVDSTALVERHWREFAGEHGLDVEVFLAGVHGRRSADIVRDHAHLLRAPAEAALRAYEERDAADLDGVRALPGAARTLAALPPHGWAVVTSATTAGARARLAAAGLPLPGVLVSADDVAAGKPDPAPYLEAARRLGLPPAGCLAVEDAPQGLRSAVLAGCRSLALLTTHRADELAGADELAADLDDIDLSVP